MPDIEVGSIQQLSGRSCKPKCAPRGRIKNRPTAPLQEARRTSGRTSRGRRVVPSGGLLAEDLTGEDKRKDGRGLLSSPSPPFLKTKSAHSIFSTHHLPTCLILFIVPLSSISATFADPWVFVRSPDRVQRLPVVRPPVFPFPAARKTLTCFAFRLLLLSAVAAPPAPALLDGAPARSDPADRGVAAE